MSGTIFQETLRRPRDPTQIPYIASFSLLWLSDPIHRQFLPAVLALNLRLHGFLVILATTSGPAAVVLWIGVADSIAAIRTTASIWWAKVAGAAEAIEVGTVGVVVFRTRGGFLDHIARMRKLPTHSSVFFAGNLSLINYDSFAGFSGFY